ncbi:transmembrane serine protease filzig isoform X2 [Lasioglossum baleicum]
MFNYECTQRNGQVVGACMDGFLFGACCQLPPKNSALSNLDKLGATWPDSFGMHEIDHVPDIPILLNPDGTPLGMTAFQDSTENAETPGNQLSNEETPYTKISTFKPPPTTIRPSSGAYIMDIIHNGERPQIPPQADFSNLEQNFGALLGQQNILNELSLPGLLAHSDKNNVQQDSNPNPVTTLLSPDQILQIADPVDQLPALFSQGLGQNNHTSADTILLNENGTTLNETYNPDELFKPSTESSTESRRVSETTQRPKVTEPLPVTTKKKPSYHGSTYQSNPGTPWIKFPDQFPSFNSDQKFGTPSMTKSPSATTYSDQQSTTTEAILETNVFEKASTVQERVSTKDVEATGTGDERTTTPMSTLSSEKDDDLIRVPTITYDTPSGNKKDDTVDKAEQSINHIISILNNTRPGSGTTIQTPHVPTGQWVSIDEPSKPSKPSLLKISTTKASTPAPFNTQTFPYEVTYSTYPTTYSHSSRPSTQASNYGYTRNSTANPPAPTVIVLGPFGTELSTETTKVITKKPEATKPTAGYQRPGPLTTKKPSVSTTITHNISTVIEHIPNNSVVSTSIFSVKVKDGTTSKPTVSNNYITEPVVAEETQTSVKIPTRRPTIFTTLAPWSYKPNFPMKHSTPSLIFADNEPTPVSTVFVKDTSVSTTIKIKTTTPPPPCEDETPAPDDLINFPPVRNPNLNISAPISQQEKPTIVESFNNTRYPEIEILDENDIPTPTFIEDDVLTNKVDTFVNKIVQSLQVNFQDLKDVVYNRANATTVTPATPTKRPSSTTKKPVRRPASTTKPLSSTTKRPATTKRPVSRPTSTKPSATEKPARPSKPTTLKPKPTTVSSATTKKPQVTTKRTRPTRRPTTTVATSTEAVVLEEEETSPAIAVETTTVAQTTAGNDLRSQCGIRPLAREGKIVGGKSAYFGKWPWQVLIREATWLGLFTKNKCGGVLITEKYVVTAAHCQPGFLATLVAVFGEYDLSGELEDKRSATRNVRRVIVNRGYDPTTFENDLALLELDSPIVFDEHIVPICMPDDGIDFTGRMATVTGWGRLKYNGGVPSTLQEVQVPIIKNSVCQEMFQTAGHSKLILDSFLCAGYATGQKDSCEGDSGGPLVMQRPDGRWFLVGTVSHGIKCAAPYLPGVYMRTTFFKPWLQGVTGTRGLGN